MSNSTLCATSSAGAEPWADLEWRILTALAQDDAGSPVALAGAPARIVMLDEDEDDSWPAGGDEDNDDLEDDEDLDDDDLDDDEDWDEDDDEDWEDDEDDDEDL